MIRGTLSGRALSVLSLLLVEGLFLAMRFDTARLLELRSYWWARPLAYASEVPRFVLAAATVFLLLESRSTSEDKGEEESDEPPQRGWWFVSLHVGALGAFALVTKRVLEGSPSAGLGWVVAWLLSGLLTVALLLPIIARPLDLWRLARRRATLLFAALAVGFVAWAAGHAAVGLAGGLQRWTSRAVFVFVSIFRPDAFYRAEEFLVGTPRFEVEIAPACSGYEGIGLIVVFLAVFLRMHREDLRFPRAFVLVPVGVLAAALANVARLGLLVLIGERSPALASGGFHSYAGALLFSMIALGIAAGVQRLRWFAATPRQARPAAEDEPSGASVFVAPLFVFLTVQLVTGLLSSGAVDVLYPVRVAVAGGALWLYRSRCVLHDRSLDWAAVAIGLGVAVAWVALTGTSTARTEALIDLATHSPRAVVVVWLFVRAVGSVIVVPIIEELAFRGYLMRRLVSRDFETVDYHSVPALSVAVSSVLFGLMHSQVLGGVLAGVAYALAARRRGRLFDAVVAHALSNAALILFAVATGRFSAWL